MAKTIHHKDSKAFFGDEDHLEASKRISYPAMLFDFFSEKKPSEGELKIFELILNLTIDHGPDSPSGKAVVVSAKAGKTISEAVASGVLEINDAHGGAGEECMEIFYRIKKEGINLKDVVAEYLADKKKIPGFGHRIYEIDPRAELVFKTMEELRIGAEYILIAKELEKELKIQSGKNLPVNIDGAIAAVFCAFGWAPRLAKAVFITARVPGLCGQFINNCNE